MKGSKPTQLFIVPGSTIVQNEREYVILNVMDLTRVVAKETGSQQTVMLTLGGMTPPRRIAKEEYVAPERDILSVSTEDWAIAEDRRERIGPMLGFESRYNKELAKKIAAEAGVSRATLYRWVAAFRDTGQLSALLPSLGRKGRKGEKRISAEVEAVIADVIENFFEDDKHPTPSATIVEVRRRCSNAKLTLPAANTIRMRIAESQGRDSTKKRYGEAAAHDQFDPIKGSIPDADWPLAIVQIDHTLLPVIIVDDEHRKPINRAWLTVAIDCNSRVCLGMYLALDGPSAVTTGMCISHAILPKEEWMAKMGITKYDWPCWGVMGALHMDNAKEFRGEMLRYACKDYDIDLKFRPLKKPRYGAYIERFMGTVTEALKTVNGTTFSGVNEKGEYDSTKCATLTFSEAEQWLTLLFVKYHRTTHAGIGTTPLTKLREGLLGTKGKPGRGLPARRLDGEVLKILYTPFEMRTVQNYGVVIDRVCYYHDVLRPWINSMDPKHPRNSRVFRFHRDPRDISFLYFYDEIANQYYKIPYRDTSHPPVSVWELRAAQKKAQERKQSPDDERVVFEIINEMREIEQGAALKTKTARVKEQRRIEHKKIREEKAEKSEKAGKASNAALLEPSGLPPGVKGYDPDLVVPLEEE